MKCQQKEGIGKVCFPFAAAAKMIWLNFWRFLKPKRMLMTYILTDVLRSKNFLFSRKKSTNCKMLSMKMRPSLKLRNVLILSKNLFSVGKEQHGLKLPEFILQDFQVQYGHVLDQDSLNYFSIESLLMFPKKSLLQKHWR